MAATIIGCTGLTTTQAQPLDLPISVWDAIITIRGGYGYKDNLTLAHTATESSPFIGSGLEVLVMRYPKDGAEWTFLLNAEDKHYLDSTEVEQEQVLLTQAQFKKRFEEAGEVSATVEYLYQDEFQDVSVTETNLQAVRVRGHTLSGGPAFRLNYPAQFWGSLEIAPARHWFAEPLDDDFEFGPHVTLGRDYGFGSEVGLQYTPGYRTYDTAAKLTTSGETITNSHRAFSQHELRLQWRHYWDSERQWRNTTRLIYKVSRDNGSGYFDYDKLGAAEQIRFHTKRWDFSAEARISYYQYAVQTADPPSHDPRRRTELMISVRAERQLTKSLRFFATFEREQSFANVTLENYTANTVLGGLQWEF